MIHTVINSVDPPRPHPSVASITQSLQRGSAVIRLALLLGLSGWLNEVHPAGTIVQREWGRNATATILAAARSSPAAAAKPRPQVDGCLWKCFPERTHQAVEDCDRASELRWGIPLLKLSWLEASAVTRVIAGVLGAGGDGGGGFKPVLSPKTVWINLPCNHSTSPLPFVLLAWLFPPPPSPSCGVNRASCSEVCAFKCNSDWWMFSPFCCDY